MFPKLSAEIKKKKKKNYSSQWEMLEKLRGENQTTGNFSVCNLKKEKRKKKCKSMFRVPTIPPEIILTLLSCVSPQRLKVARVY